MTRKALTVAFTRRAAIQIQEANTWWRSNRQEASGAIAEEVERAIGLLALQPAAGAPARAVRLRGVRRILLSRVGYHLYSDRGARVLARQARFAAVALSAEERDLLLTASYKGNDMCLEPDSQVHVVRIR